MRKNCSRKTSESSTAMCAARPIIEFAVLVWSLCTTWNLPTTDQTCYGQQRGSKLERHVVVYIKLRTLVCAISFLCRAATKRWRLDFMHCQTGHHSSVFPANHFHVVITNDRCCSTRRFSRKISVIWGTQRGALQLKTLYSTRFLKLCSDKMTLYLGKPMAKIDIKILTRLLKATFFIKNHTHTCNFPIIC